MLEPVFTAETRPSDQIMSKMENVDFFSQKKNEKTQFHMDKLKKQLKMNFFQITLDVIVIQIGLSLVYSGR
jgi:hypothetical protein